jgi:hypothetical protein
VFVLLYAEKSLLTTSFYSSLTSSRGYMKKVIWIVILIVLLLAACNSEPQRNEPTDSTLTPNDFGTAASDFAEDVASPKGGAGAIVVGVTNGSLDGTNKGQSDAFIRRYDSGGALWAQQFGTRGSEFATGVAVTPTGVSYVVGDTTGALGFKIGKRDSFLRKYDAKGVLLWTRQFGTTGDDRAEDVTLDASNNIYVLSKDGNVLVIRKFNPSGTLLRTITNTDPNITELTALGIDSTGNILVLTRYFTGSKFVAKLFRYNNGGALLDSPTVFDPSGQLDVFDLVVDGSDNLYISLFDAVLVRGGVVRKLTNTGTTIWTQRVEPVATSISARPRALAVDKDNNVYVTGETTSAYSGFTNKGGRDIFVLKLATATGLRLWTQQLGGNGSDSGFGIVVSDAVYVAGSSSSSPNLVGDPSSGGDDAYLAQFQSATGTLLGIDQ